MKSLPGFEEVLKNNPTLLNKLMKGMMNSNDNKPTNDNRPPPRQQPPQSNVNPFNSTRNDQ